MQRRCICAALRHKYVLERPKEYLAAFVREYGLEDGARRWHSFQEFTVSNCPKEQRSVARGTIGGGKTGP